MSAIGNRLRPAGSAVDHCKEVFEAPVGGEGAHNVDVDVGRNAREAPGVEGLAVLCAWRPCLRAGLALTGPTEYVASHAAPGVGPGDDGQCGLAGRVGEVVKIASKIERQWASGTSTWGLPSDVSHTTWRSMHLESERSEA